MITESDAGYFSDYYFNHNLGLAYRFGKPKDSDGDGVPDKEDACPERQDQKKKMSMARWMGTVLDKDDACPILQDR